MNFTVNDALKVGVLSQGEILAGENGLDRIIESVSVIEIPKETLWFRGGELQISAFYSIADDIGSQLKVLHNLHECKCSGLILCHVGFWLKSIHPSLIQLANELNFPIIKVPDHVAYTDVITPIMDALLHIQSNKLEYALNIYEKMTTIALDNKGINYLIFSLEKLINKSVLFFDSNNKCLSQIKNNSPNDFLNEIRELIQANINQFGHQDDFIHLVSKLTHIPILLAPVIISKKYYGTIVIIDTFNLSEMDLIAVSKTKNACALALLENKSMNEFNSSIRKSYITDLIHWNFDDEESAIIRAESIHFDISKIRLVMVLDISKSYILNKNLNGTTLRLYRNKLYKFVIEVSKKTDAINSVIVFNNKILLLINCNRDCSTTLTFAKTLGEKIINTPYKDLNIPISIGIGNYYTSLSEIQNSYSESIIALNIGNSIIHQACCVTYQEIELLSLLFKNIDELQISSVLERLFEPLKSYDNKNGTSLLLTLKTLLDHQFNTTVVAEQLFVHINTVFQRKKKICELLPSDPTEYPYKTLYEIANILEKFTNK